MSDILTITNLSRLAYKGSVLNPNDKKFDVNLFVERKFKRRLKQFGFSDPVPIRVDDLFAYIVRKDGFTYVIVRGTANNKNFMRDIDYGRMKKKEGKVYKGFEIAAMKLYKPIMQELDLGEKIKTGGHSFGSAVSHILANKLFKSDHYIVCAVGNGSPSVGGKDYVKNTDWFPRYDIINNLDIVGELPPKWLHWKHYETIYIDSNDNLKTDYSYFWRKIDRLKTLIKHKNIFEYGSDHMAADYCDILGLEKNQSKLKELEYWND